MPRQCFDVLVYAVESYMQISQVNSVALGTIEDQQVLRDRVEVEEADPHVTQLCDEGNIRVVEHIGHDPRQGEACQVDDVLQPAELVSEYLGVSHQL